MQGTIIQYPSTASHLSDAGTLCSCQKDSPAFAGINYARGVSGCA